MCVCACVALLFGNLTPIKVKHKFPYAYYNNVVFVDLNRYGLAHWLLSVAALRSALFILLVRRRASDLPYSFVRCSCGVVFSSILLLLLLLLLVIAQVLITLLLLGFHSIVLPGCTRYLLLGSVTIVATGIRFCYNATYLNTFQALTLRSAHSHALMLAIIRCCVCACVFFYPTRFRCVPFAPCSMWSATLCMRVCNNSIGCYITNSFIVSTLGWFCCCADERG